MEREFFVATQKLSFEDFEIQATAPTSIAALSVATKRERVLQMHKCSQSVSAAIDPLNPSNHFFGMHVCMAPTIDDNPFLRK